MKTTSRISNRFLKRLFCAVVFCLSSSAYSTSFLDNTVFYRAGMYYQIDPKLIYAVALAESSYLHGRKSDHLVAPHKFALRANKAYYPKTQEDAESTLKELLAKNDSVDIGIMQINSKWHGKTVKKIEHLLDVEVNVFVGTRILVNAINRCPDDLELGVGHYNSWQDDEKAREYGKFVLAIYERLKNYD